MDTLKPFHIICEDIFKIYKIEDLEVVALRGLDLKVRQGEVVAIVGASGSGKRTLLNILAGYDHPSAGSIFVGTRNLLQMHSKDIEEYRRSEVGFIWQQTNRNLFPYLTAIENVTLPMMLTNEAEESRDRRASELLDLVGLSDRAKHTPDKLSGGEQQRVAIAVALSNNPKLLLADEPTGELDDKTASEILDLLGVVNRELETTILIVTHDPDIAYKVGRVVLIRDGKTSTEIKRSEQYSSISGISDTNQELEEFVLVDGNGRIQIPRDLLSHSGIQEKAKVILSSDGIIITPNK